MPPPGSSPFGRTGSGCISTAQRGERLGSARMDRIAEYGLAACYREIPLTLEEARKMEAITRPAAEALFPGWTMGFYEEYNFGHMASRLLLPRGRRAADHPQGVAQQRGRRYSGADGYDAGSIVRRAAGTPANGGRGNTAGYERLRQKRSSRTPRSTKPPFPLRKPCWKTTCNPTACCC